MILKIKIYTLLTLALNLITLPTQAQNWGVSIGGVSWNQGGNRGCQTQRAWNPNPYQRGACQGGYITYNAPSYIAPPPVIYMQPYQNWRQAAYPPYQPVIYTPAFQAGGYYCR